MVSHDLSASVRLVLAIIILASCGGGEPTAVTPPPPPPPEPHSVGSVVTDSVAAGELRRIYFKSSSAMTVRALLTRTGGSTVRVAITDSASGAQLGSIDSLSFGQVQTLESEFFSVDASKTFVLTVSAYPGNTGGRFQLSVVMVASAPEGRNSAFIIGDTVTETLSSLSDIDDFTFSGEAGTQVIVFFRVPPATYVPLLEISCHSFPSKLSGHANIASDLEEAAVDTLTLPCTGQYRARVRYNPLSIVSEPLTFDLQVRAIDRAPEGRSAAISVNDSVTEAIAHVGDVDVYSFSGVAGQEFTVLMRQLGGVPLSQLAMELSGNGVVVPTLNTKGTDTSLVQHSTPRFVLPANGTYQLVIRSAVFKDRLDRGPYLFWLRPLNRAPEIAPATVSPGDSVWDELPVPAEVDEYSFTLASPATVNVAIYREDIGFTPGVSLVDAGQQVIATIPTTNFFPPFGVGTGPVTLSSGTYRIRVAADVPDPSFPTFLGPYALQLLTVDTVPEGTASAIATGDTVHAAIERAGDVDVYTFSGAAGQGLSAWFTSTENGVCGCGGELRLRIRPAGTISWLPFAEVRTPAAGPVNDTGQTYRIDLASSATYELQVGSLFDGSSMRERGSYRFVVRPVERAPEQVSPVLAVGDSIAEMIDNYGDVDTFSITGTPGQLVSIVMGWRGGALNPSFPTFLGARLDRDGDTSRILELTPFLYDRGSGHVTIPASGTIGVTVFERRLSGYLARGSYMLLVAAVDSTPEGHSGTLTSGDTVSSALGPIGDVDTFTFAAAAGDTLDIMFHVIATPQVERYIRLKLQTPGGATLINATAIPFFGPVNFQPVVVPAAGAQQIIIEGELDSMGVGTYRLVVRKR